MTARVRIPLADLAAGERILDPRSAKYLAVVLRARAGDGFVAFDPARGLEARGRIVSVERGSVRVALEAPGPGFLAARPPALLVQALAKGDKMDAIVRDATELGATRILPVVTAFAVVTLDPPRAAERRDRWARVAEQAARQCGRSDVPVVDAPAPFAQGIAAAAQTSTHRFCLYEKATAPLGPPLVLAAATGEGVAFVAGPEGGLSTEEVEAAVRAGFEPVSLGDLILRTETVAACVLGALQVLRPPRAAPEV